MPRERPPRRAERLLAGEDPDFAFCGLRPPGHHAETRPGDGLLPVQQRRRRRGPRDRRLRRRAGADPRLGRPPRQRDRGDLRRARRRPLREHPPEPALSRAPAPPGRRGTGAGEGYTVNLPVAAGRRRRGVPGAGPARRRADRPRVRARPDRDLGRLRRPRRRPARRLRGEHRRLRRDDGVDP